MADTKRKLTRERWEKMTLKQRREEHKAHVARGEEVPWPITPIPDPDPATATVVVKGGKFYVDDVEHVLVVAADQTLRAVPKETR